MNRSVATIRSANISTTSPAMASSNRSMCRPIGPRNDSRTRPPGCSAPPKKPAGRMPSSPMRISARTTCARSSTGSSATRWCGACACSCTGTRTRSIALPRMAICARIPTIRRNVARLADYGWSFDLQVFAPQMPGAAGLAEACPKVTFVLQHAGMLEDLSPAGRAPGAPAWCGWRRVRTSSASSRGSAPSFIATTLRISPLSLPSTVAIFGPDRCLFGSNFPIEKLWTDYRALVDAYLDAVKSNPQSSRCDHARHGDAGLSDRALVRRGESKRRKTGGKYGFGNQDS